ncbi:hypothetical protein F441_20801 [Phytophthora nicotianae CJ01A1]|nr:hypothetical protein F441_20801 [Phytophthora nicotianae CJ01A1]
MVDAIDFASANDVLFSKRVIFLDVEDNLIEQQWIFKKNFPQLLTALLNSSRLEARRSLGMYATRFCLPSEVSNPLQLGRLKLVCSIYELCLSEIESMFSALVTNHTTKDLSMELIIQLNNDRESRHWWR